MEGRVPWLSEGVSEKWTQTVLGTFQSYLNRINKLYAILMDYLEAYLLVCNYVTTSTQPALKVISIRAAPQP
jgi:hypothetical protein